MNAEDGKTTMVELADGTAAVLRALRPGDKAGLIEGFERLSPETRYKRFFSYKTELTDQEVRALTEFDGVTHYVLGAMTLDSAGDEHTGIGLARFVRCEDDEETAEFAVVVADDWQGKGLGSALCARLVDEALARGVRRLRASVLADNSDALALVKRLSRDAARAEADGVVSLEFKIASAHGRSFAAVNRKLYSLLRLAAEDKLRTRISAWFGKVAKV